MNFFNTYNIYLYIEAHDFFKSKPQEASSHVHIAYNDFLVFRTTPETKLELFDFEVNC